MWELWELPPLIPAGANAWSDANALFVGMNSLVCQIQVRWALDLGRDDYESNGYWDLNPADSSNRWQYYRKRAEGNNTLAIGSLNLAGKIVTGRDGGQNLSVIAPIHQLRVHFGHAAGGHRPDHGLQLDQWLSHNHHGPLGNGHSRSGDDGADLERAPRAPTGCRPAIV
jgi:hypothetical protein